MDAWNIKRKEESGGEEWHTVESLRSSNLCAACQRMFASSTTKKDWHLLPASEDSSNKKPTITTSEVLAGGHQRHPDACKASAQQGCRICYIVFERFCILFERIVAFTRESGARILTQYSFTEYQIRRWREKRKPVAQCPVHEDTWVLEITFESVRRANRLPTQFDSSECLVEFLLLPTQGRSRANRH